MQLYFNTVDNYSVTYYLYVTVNKLLPFAFTTATVTCTSHFFYLQITVTRHSEQCCTPSSGRKRTTVAVTSCPQPATTSCPQPTPTHPLPCTTSSISVGSFVALYMEKYRKEVPMIGKVLRSGGSDKFEIEWWRGRYTTKWTVCKKRKGRQSVPWHEVVPTKSVVMTVKFTRAFHLNRETVSRLKNAYMEVL